MNQVFHSTRALLAKHKSAVVLFLIAFMGAGAGTGSAESAADRMIQVSRDTLCVTEGEISETSQGLLSVSVPKMRAYVNAWTAPDVEARFTYQGPSAQESRLGSGVMRRQFGLKLRAQDPCNLVYAMWRMEPESKLVVSVKSNPGQSTSAECSNHGYHNIKPRRSSALPVLTPGAAHTLRAAMNGEEITVFVDGTAAWEGSVGPDAGGLQGPVGIRSDNARLEILLKAGQPREVHPNYVVACKTGPGESE